MRGVNPNGIVIYEGPSELTDERIVAIATGVRAPSQNRKTGAMVQVWILAAFADPVRAKKTGGDVAVCGSCPIKAECYVNLGQAPRAIWRTWNANRYARGEPADLAGKIIRLGAYGDPAALPRKLLEEITSVAAGWTGYTHQWRDPKFHFSRSMLMASVESEKGRAEAGALGFRTFRVAPTHETVRGEIVCPNVQGVQCADCLLCSGLARPRARSILVQAHGPKAGRLKVVG